MEGWKELEYNIPAYNKETHTVNGYDFEELSNKVVAHAIIVEIEEIEEEMNELLYSFSPQREGLHARRYYISIIRIIIYRSAYLRN